VGVKAEYELGRFLLNAVVTGGDHQFIMQPLDGDTNPPNVAGVAYKHVRAGGGVRARITDKISAMAGAAWLQIFQAGPITDFDYFPYASFVGGDAFAGVAYALPFMKNLEARATLDVRRYVFNMNSTAADLDQANADRTGRAAGGATDDYIGINLAIAYRSFE
jgi:hypothetical protein